MELVTAAQFSRDIKVTKAAVSKALKSGRLDDAKVDRDGKVFLEKDKAFKLWEQTSDPSHPRGRKTEIVKRDSEEIPSFNESRAKREAMMARLAEIDVEEREKLLVPSDDVKKAWVQLVTIAKTKVLGIPTKAKQRIPDLDKGAMGLLDEIVRETLEDLAVENAEAA
jgi:hypothetical protein|tara:strand:- start:609 stop:1109 length:501 start_codon:yes stop_codon:yes gene_type:complete